MVEDLCDTVGSAIVATRCRCTCTASVSPTRAWRQLLFPTGDNYTSPLPLPLIVSDSIVAFSCTGAGS